VQASSCLLLLEIAQHPHVLHSPRPPLHTQGLLHVSNVLCLLPLVYSLSSDALGEQPPPATHHSHSQQQQAAPLPAVLFSSAEEGALKQAVLQALGSALAAQQQQQQQGGQEQQQGGQEQQQGEQEQQPCPEAGSVLDELLPSCEGPELGPRVDAFFERLHWAAQVRARCCCCCCCCYCFVGSCDLTYAASNFQPRTSRQGAKHVCELRKTMPCLVWAQPPSAMQCVHTLTPAMPPTV